MEVAAVSFAGSDAAAGKAAARQSTTRTAQIQGMFNVHFASHVIIRIGATLEFFHGHRLRLTLGRAIRRSAIQVAATAQKRLDGETLRERMTCA